MAELKQLYRNREILSGALENAPDTDHAEAIQKAIDKINKQINEIINDRKNRGF
jgi:hypothetical protein